MTLYLKGHQSCSLSKFEGFYFLHRNRVFSNFQLWHLVTLMPLEVQGQILPFWKPLINTFQDLDCHGCCSTLKGCQAMLKIVFYLVCYYKHLISNEHHCKSHFICKKALTSPRWSRFLLCFLNNWYHLYIFSIRIMAHKDKFCSRFKMSFCFELFLTNTSFFLNIILLFYQTTMIQIFSR